MKLIRRLANVALAATTAFALLSALPASADTTTTNGAPLTCTTNPDVGTQHQGYSVSVTDTPDPAAVGGTVTYRIVAPFAAANPGVTAYYEGGTVKYPIPSTFSVTSVSTQNPSGQTKMSSTVAVQSGHVVVTTTTSSQTAVPIDGTSYPTPDVIVVGTVGSGAAGPGVSWLIPDQIVATAYVPGLATIVATCTPDDPTTVIAHTTVPGANSPPVANDQTITLQPNSARVITLTGSDPNGDPITFAIATQPTHGALTGTPPTVTYTPASGYTGPDSFTFTVTDSHGASDTGTITLNVGGTVVDQTPPTITITAPKNGAVYAPTSNISASYACADTLTGVAQCAGTVASGTPVSLSVGVHTFTVSAKDGSNNTAERLVSYRVIDPTAVVQHYTGAGTDAVPVTCDQPLTNISSLPLVMSAATQVPANATFAARAAFGQQSVPQLIQYSDLHYTFAPPTNATFAAASIVPGTGSSNATSGATATITNNRAVLTVPGPITGGATGPTAFTPPAMGLTLKATGAPTTVATTKFESLVFTRTVGAVPQTVTCTAGDPANNLANPTLTHTTIIDVTPPVAKLTTPKHGGVYDQGASLSASYSCSDAVNLASCVGTTAKGAAVATGTPGAFSYKVIATDAAGNKAEAYASYVVLPPVTYHIHVTSATYAAMKTAATDYGVGVKGIPKIGVRVLVYIYSLTPNAPPQPVPPVANDGPIDVAISWPAHLQSAIEATAAHYGLSGDDLHFYATAIVLYVDSLQH